MGLTGITPGQASAKPTPVGELASQLVGLLTLKPPTTALTAAIAAGGSMDAGTHVYAVAFLGPNGLTVPGPSSAAITSASTNNTGSLSAIPTGPAGTTARYLYRSKANTTAPLYLCGIISDNSTTTFSDPAADADLGDPSMAFVSAQDFLEALQMVANTISAQAGLILGPTGTLLLNLQVYSPSLSPAAVAANTTAEQTFTVTGLATNDKILFINKPTAQAGLGIVGMRVSAANTLAITFSNNTGSSITPTASETYQVGALRS